VQRARRKPRDGERSIRRRPAIDLDSLETIARTVGESDGRYMPECIPSLLQTANLWKYPGNVSPTVGISRGRERDRERDGRLPHARMRTCADRDH